MGKLGEDELKNVLSKLLVKSLSNPEPAKEIVEQTLYDDDFREQVRLLCETYIKPEYRTSKLIAKSVDIRALPSLIDVCRREKLGMIPIDFSGERVVYEENDTISILILSGQLGEFNNALLEAVAVSGSVPEMNRKDCDLFAKGIKKANPMLEIKGVKKNIYEIMKKNIEKLPYEMRFTFFPEEAESNKVNVGFFTKTQPLVIRRGTAKEAVGPYSIPKIASILLASSLLEKPDLGKNYEEIKKRDMELMNGIMDMYYDAEYPYELVPATVGKDGYNVFMDQSFHVDYNKGVDTGLMESFITSRFHGLNHTIIPMTLAEYEENKNEVIVDPRFFSFYRENHMPIYAEPEKMVNKEVSESLIEMLNRKRQQIMMISDDFNGQNLINLDNYITGSVHEFLLREDEDYFRWTEGAGKLEVVEAELLNDLSESYSMSAVYENNDKVTELINNERAGYETSRPELENEELSL